MEVVKRAAMAPAEPSGQDRAVASRAQAEESKARAEAAAQRREEAVEARTETAGQSEPGDVGSAAAAYGGEPDAEAPTDLAGRRLNFNYETLLVGLGPRYYLRARSRSRREPFRHYHRHPIRHGPRSDR